MGKPIAIDVHSHPQTEEFLRAMGARRQQMAAYFRRGREPVSFSAMADMYRDRSLMTVIVNSDDETVSGIAPAPNDLLARAQREHPDVFIAFAGIDPWKGKAAVNEIRRCHDELGMRGIGELNPGRQQFRPNSRRFYPLWEEAARLGMTVLFHTGFLGAGAGTPGGMGYKLKYTRPIPALDDIAADFPDLAVIGAHPSWPWENEALAIARHKSNYYIDLSGWAPKYIPPQVIQQANSLISDQVLFGTDWPVIDLDRYLAEFAALPLKDAVRQKVMIGNAARIFGIEVESPDN